MSSYKKYIRPRDRITTPRPISKLHSPSCPNDASLLGLPSEARNMIYTHLFSLIKDDNPNHDEIIEADMYTYPAESVDIRYTPAILRVCRQIRQEAHQMYLSATPFIAFLQQPRRTKRDGYAELLDILTALKPSQVQTIKSLTLICKDSWTTTPPNSWTITNSLTPPPQTQPQTLNYAPIPIWKAFIPALLATGISLTQLLWPGLCLSACKALQYRSLASPTGKLPHHNAKRHALAKNTKNMAILYRAIIWPTLVLYGGEEKAVIDVMKQADVVRLMPHLGRESILSEKSVEEICVGFERERFLREGDREEVDEGYVADLER